MPSANTAQQVLEICAAHGFDVAGGRRAALRRCADVLRDAPVARRHPDRRPDRNDHRACRLERILILGGTARRGNSPNFWWTDGYEVTTALAGVTSNQTCRAVRFSRRFRRRRGIARYAKAENFDRLIDATHPFAATHLGQYRLPGGDLGLPCWRLERAAWQAERAISGLRLPICRSSDGAVPAGPGVSHDRASWPRAVLRPAGSLRADPRHRGAKIALPPGWQLIKSRPPHRARMTSWISWNRNRISVLVTKNAGGRLLRENPCGAAKRDQSGHDQAADQGAHDDVPQRHGTACQVETIRPRGRLLLHCSV